MLTNGNAGETKWDSSLRHAAINDDWDDQLPVKVLSFGVLLLLFEKAFAAWHVPVLSLLVPQPISENL